MRKRKESQWMALVGFQKNEKSHGRWKNKKYKVKKLPNEFSTSAT